MSSPPGTPVLSENCSKSEEGGTLGREEAAPSELSKSGMLKLLQYSQIIKIYNGRKWEGWAIQQSFSTVPPFICWSDCVINSRTQSNWPLQDLYGMES